jgi:hypothetical protein
VTLKNGIIKATVTNPITKSNSLYHVSRYTNLCEASCCSTDLRGCCLCRRIRHPRGGFPTGPPCSKATNRDKSETSPTVTMHKMINFEGAHTPRARSNESRSGMECAKKGGGERQRGREDGTEEAMEGYQCGRETHSTTLPPPTSEGRRKASLGISLPVDSTTDRTILQSFFPQSRVLGFLCEVFRHLGIQIHRLDIALT